MPADLSPDELISLNRLTTVARTLAGTSHDLNNALQVIAGSAELLMQQDNVSDATRRAVDRIHQQTSRAAESLNELMQFARNTHATDTTVSLRTIATRAAALRAFAIRRAGLTLTIKDTTASAAMVRGHGGQLLQLVLNLILNAEQALEGSSDGTIALDVRESPTHVTLTVADNGPGIAASVKDWLFGAFVTTHPAADTHGLGLAAARVIAQRHGGDVTVDCASVGCRATLRLPPA